MEAQESKLGMLQSDLLSAEEVCLIALLQILRHFLLLILLLLLWLLFHFDTPCVANLVTVIRINFLFL